MADLRALVEGLGADDVTTYVQSGNVVLKAAAKSDELARKIEERIRRDHGLEVPVLLRTKAQLARLVTHNPFVRSRKDPAMLHVTFLADTPDRARLRKLDAQDAPPDEFQVVGREVYLHCPNGYGRSKLTNAFFEKQLAVVATTRNWRTVTTLAELAGA